MGIVMSLDTGAAFTDAVVDDGKRIVCAKVETIHRNPKMCFVKCLQEVGRKLDLSPSHMMAQTSFIRWSFSLAQELVMRKEKGSVGVIVSRGSEDEVGLPEYFCEMIPEEMFIGIGDNTQESGSIVENLNKDNVGEAIRHLVECGALDIVVSLSGSYSSVNSKEQKIREIARLEYPAHYLGSPGLFLGTESAAIEDESLRRNTAIINASLHRDVIRYASAAEDAVRDAGYTHPIFVGQGTAEVSKLHRASAASACNSAAAAAIVGCTGLVTQLYGMSDFVCMEVGGGSRAYTSLICKGQVSTTTAPVISEIPVSIPMIRVTTPAGGSGAIAWVKSEGSQVEVGPRSAAVLPKAAAYGRNGTEPTVMDAQLVLGYLDPDNFLGGVVRLQKDKAIAAVRDSIAVRIGKPLEEAAYDIVKKAEKNIAQAIQEELGRRQMNPANMTLIAFGGAGGSLCCGCAANLGIRRIIVFRFNSVASAVFSLLGKAACEGYRPIDVSELLAYEDRESDGSEALKGKRPVYWDQSFLQTDIYQLDLLVPGDAVIGPAVIETLETTYLVPPRWKFRVDQHLNGELEAQK